MCSLCNPHPQPPHARHGHAVAESAVAGAVGGWLFAVLYVCVAYGEPLESLALRRAEAADLHVLLDHSVIRSTARTRVLQCIGNIVLIFARKATAPTTFSKCYGRSFVSCSGLKRRSLWRDRHGSPALQRRKSTHHRRASSARVLVLVHGSHDIAIYADFPELILRKSESNNRILIAFVRVSRKRRSDFGGRSIFPSRVVRWLECNCTIWRNCCAHSSAVACLHARRDIEVVSAAV